VVTIVAAGVSALLLGAFWSNQLVLGIVVDAALIAAAVIRPELAESLVAWGQPCDLSRRISAAA
jgi:hypothetical protein